VDDHGDYLFIIFQSLARNEDTGNLAATEVAFYLGPSYVISCHQQPVPAFLDFRSRLERGDNLPARTATWLLHGLLDTLVDSYLPLVDELDDEIDEIEARVLGGASTEVLERIMVTKRNALRLRRATVPSRDIMNRLSRNEFPKLISTDAAIYFRDIYDHLVRTEYLVDTLRDLADGALQTYLSAVSNRLNEVMKVLTAAATIFLPLTVITGIYGMNFDQNVFPGFHESWGFAAVVGAMFVNSLVMLAYFRYRRWV
jgi:magnesium transporter